ncbi:MAG: alanine--tRNA ligase [Paracoccaceae bacterium]
MAGLAEIRSTFLNYFKKHGHEEVKSSTLVPSNDPTLMFTNSGMVQFKNVFTGIERRSYDKAVTSQKCLRAGGKHNDLDNVGYTSRHHTFFEMLGNFSFGNYFKETAIPLAWDLITKEFSLPRDRLLVTVFHNDKEAIDIWKKYAGLSDSQIIKINTTDNFWSMGPTGPCGPCSEIFFDHGSKINGGPPGSPNEDGDRFVEIWNLVFMQYDQLDGDRRENLPRPSIDTGMGLERMGAVLQGTHDNYNTDLMRALIEESANLSNQNVDGKFNIHHRVIADHIRSISFLIAEGIFPSNEGRGYVLRRIMRRAMRHIHFLGVNEPMLHKMVSSLTREMGAAFPELIEAKDLIEESLLNEEIKFRSTLDRGLKLLDKEIKRLNKGEKFSGELAFKLYDTYGFPIDLTQDAVREINLEVDMKSFNISMEKQKEKARNAWIGSGERKIDQVWFDLANNLDSTEFLGYNNLIAQAKVLAIVLNGRTTDRVAEGNSAEVIFNQSPFYAESGGQISDSGYINNEIFEAEIEDIKKISGLIIHKINIIKGQINNGDLVKLTVDLNKRRSIAANHSATHLMHQALKDVIGVQVNQRGSLNDSERLRFDFSSNKAMSKYEIEKVEQIVNKHILEDTIIDTRLMDIDEAKKLGAQALFSEKYDNEVRVIMMGFNQTVISKASSKNKRYSMELCGGTHVQRTGMIGSFIIKSEIASSSGVRRIEALTGLNAVKYLQLNRSYIDQITTILKIPIESVNERLITLIKDKKSFTQKIDRLKITSSAIPSLDKSNEIKVIKGVSFVVNKLQNIPIKEMRSLTDDCKKKFDKSIILNLSNQDNKIIYTVGVTSNLTDKYSASEIIKILNQLSNGKGGGRPDFAQGGGSDEITQKEIIKNIEIFIKEN